MAILRLQTSVKLKSDGTSFFFGDITPLFNAVSSPYGYDTSGTPTGFPASDVDTNNLQLEVTDPEGNITNITIPDTSFVEANIGTTGAITYEVTATALDYSGILPDGVYKFKYTITNIQGTGQWQNTCIVVSDFNICCCLNKKLIDLTACDTCTFEKRSKKLDDLYNAWMLKQKAYHLANCGDFAGAQKTLDALKVYCDIKRCDSC